MKNIFVTVLAAVALLAGSTTMSAQSPDQQLGVGLTIGNGYGPGGHVAYALSPSFHLGAMVGFAVGSVITDNGESTTSTGYNDIMLGAYGKLILMGSKELKPYFSAAIAYKSGSREVANNTSVNTSVLGLWIAGGAEYFVTPNFGIYGQIRLVDLPISTSDGVTTQSAFLLGAPAIGVEWFL